MTFYRPKRTFSNGTSVSLPGYSSGSNDNTSLQSMKSSLGASLTPDFMKQNPSAKKYADELAKIDQQRAEKAASGSITRLYDNARKQLTAPTPVSSYATEKQRREHAWDRRIDPLGVRDAQRNFNATFNRAPTPRTSSTSRPTNFQGPRSSFGA